MILMMWILALPCVVARISRAPRGVLDHFEETDLIELRPVYKLYRSEHVFDLPDTHLCVRDHKVRWIVMDADVDDDVLQKFITLMCPQLIDKTSWWDSAVDFTREELKSSTEKVNDFLAVGKNAFAEIADKALNFGGLLKQASERGVNLLEKTLDKGFTSGGDLLEEMLDEGGKLAASTATAVTGVVAEVNTVVANNTDAPARYLARTLELVNKVTDRINPLEVLDNTIDTCVAVSNEWYRVMPNTTTLAGGVLESGYVVASDAVEVQVSCMNKVRRWLNLDTNS